MDKLHIFEDGFTIQPDNSSHQVEINGKRSVEVVDATPENIEKHAKGETRDQLLDQSKRRTELQDRFNRDHKKST